MTEPQISFVLATMNRRSDLQRCLKSVYRQQFDSFEVVVVDNGSSDSTAEMLRQDHPAVRVIRLPENRGAAGGKTIALRNARGEFIIQLDDDEEFPDNDVCQGVISYFARYPEAGVLSFNIIDPETGETGVRTVPRRDKNMLRDDSRCGYFLGGGCAFRAKVLKEVGYYWERLNPYGSEEIDLSYRILDAGYAIIWTKSIRILHYESNVARPRGRRVYFETRNRPWVALRNLPWPYVVASFVAWWGYGALLATRSGDITSFLRGLSDCIAGIPAILRERRVVKRTTLDALRAYSGPLYY